MMATQDGIMGKTGAKDIMFHLLIGLQKWRINKGLQEGPTWKRAKVTQEIHGQKGPGEEGARGYGGHYQETQRQILRILLELKIL